MKKFIVGLLTTTTLLLGTLVPLHTNNVQAATMSYKDKAIYAGKNVLGTPYRWGGTTPRGFDCSGFVGYAYKKAGKSLPRTSSDMYKKLKHKVSRKKLQKGDIIFFQTYKKGASHVAIYVGSNKFIHASDDGVKIDSLSNRYWSPRYYGAARV